MTDEVRATPPYRQVAQPGLIPDLFAGPGGWSQGLAMLGLSDIGLELDAAACLTRSAAGHQTIRTDVEQYPTEPFIGKTWGLIASPPCPDFSLAGKRAGITGETGRLMAQVLRWVDALRPQWVACEQVPQALPYWEDYAATLRSWGYFTWTGVLNAADYGVPQTRKRALLLAHADRPVAPPEPTHAEHPQEGLWGSVEPWVTMVEAVGWGLDQPAATISGGGARTGGWEPFANAAYRKRLARTVVDRRTNSKDGRGGMVPTVPVPVTRPAPTLTGKATTQWIIRDLDGEGRANLTVRDAAILQSFAADYPFQGQQGQQGQQVGNAVPPLLAAHALAAVLGVAAPKTSEVAA
jgi:DNA (cytosine-5)-methyltransferase 1